MVTRKSAVMPSSERAGLEADFWAEVKEASQTISGKCKHGQPDVEFSLTSMVGKRRESDGLPTVRTYERSVWAQTEDGAIVDTIRRAFHDRHGKLSADDCREWAAILAWESQSYSAQAMPIRAEEKAIVSAAELKAEEERKAKEAPIRAMYEQACRDGDRMLMASFKAMLV